MNDSPALDPLTLPLLGTRLIEASAGTGKTWTIAALYLRFVLGHGTVSPRTPAQILVMTFTQAATRELVERIRSRLVTAAARFRDDEKEATNSNGTLDPFLEQLVSAFPAGPAREQAAWRLAQAAEAMDDAAIFTIDAWCQRMLREHAFDSGSLFDEELEPDETALRHRAVRDYWRQQVYPLKGAALDTVLGLWKNVEALETSTRPLSGLALGPQACDRPLNARVQEDLVQLAAQRRAWVAKLQALSDWLQQHLQDPAKPFNGRRLTWNKCSEWLSPLLEWAKQDVVPDLPKLTDTAWDRLSPIGITQALNPGVTLQPHPVLAELTQLREARGGLGPVQSRLRLHAAASIERRMAQLKSQGGRFGFADLLHRLQTALDPAQDPARAKRMRERMLEQYPVALVDEFQDTSPAQLAIFEHLHGLGERTELDPPGRALLLIGDPKQAIYGFRGADIRSYLRARRATSGRHHRLHTNHRSSEALVNAVNQLFVHAELRQEGAFRMADGTDPSELPFVPVKAQGRRDRLLEVGQGVDPLVVCFHADPSNATSYLKHFAALAAERIVTMLNSPGTGFEDDGGAFTRIQPGDIAVLVRQRIEAEALQRALRLRGVASVYLSDRDSVFASDEAREVLRLLMAIASPRSLRLARAAAATGLMGYSLDRLRLLADDEIEFDGFCDGLADLLPVWRGQGVLAMLRQALHRFRLPARWLAEAELSKGGERRLTNVLHLAELLQAASATLEGEAALLRWLSARIDDAREGRTGPSGEDAAILRLESDAGRVQVVTVHKSKGLEYPVVFLPFASVARPVKKGPGTFVRPGFEAAAGTHPRGAASAADPAPGLILEPDAAERAALDEDRLREDLRLLYVALTRARHQLWVGCGVLTRGNARSSTWHQSALGSLLTGAEALTEAELTNRLAEVLEPMQGVRLDRVEGPQPAAVPPRSQLQPRGPLPELLPAPDYLGRFDTRWAISSYSAMVKSTGSVGSATRSAPAVVTLHRPLVEDEPAGDDEPSQGSTREGPPLTPVGGAAWHRFPRGAFAGNFLHDELEWLAGEAFALPDSLSLQQALERRCERKGWGNRKEDVREWLGAVCSAPLPSLGVPLKGLDGYLAEMEFWFPTEGLDTAAVDDLCRRHLLPGLPRPPLPPRTLTGLLMGFADLVFVHGNRHGVLDYKSNTLGTEDADYTPQAMARAMLDNRYDVQAALYGVALHRLLRRRLGVHYQPEEHLHGAIYFFLRGVAAPGAGAFHLHLPTALLDGLDALLPTLDGVSVTS